VLSGLSPDKRSAASSFSKIRLTPEEERIYRKVDGTRTVQAIIDATGLGEFEVCRVLFDLLNRNIITSAGRGEAKEILPGQTDAAPSSRSAYIVVAVVLAISLVAVYVRRQTPFAVTGRPPVLTNTYGLLLEGVTRSRLDRLDRGILAYQLWNGNLPRTLEDVVSVGLVDRSYLKDPHARPYHYVHTDAGYLLSAVDDRGKTESGTLIERTLPLTRP
jgi:hypothetical protein